MNEEALARVGPQRQEEKTYNYILSHFTTKISALQPNIQDMTINIYTSYQNFPTYTSNQREFLERIFLNFLSWNIEDRLQELDYFV